MSAPPILETGRLRLREHRASDLEDYAAMWADPRVTRFIGGQPMSREQAWVRLLRYRGMWVMLGFGFWAIEDRETGRFLGEAGVHELQRDIRPRLAGTLEAGWGLIPQAHGRGLAREAMRAVLGWADDAFPDRAQTCIIAEPNAPSIRMAADLGFRDRPHGLPRRRHDPVRALAGCPGTSLNRHDL